jgi:hypothetical protein
MHSGQISLNPTPCMDAEVPLIFESALSFPCPTSMKSNEAFPCVKPNVKSLKSSGFSRDPSRRRAFESPVILAHTLAIISISSVSSLQCSRTEFRRILAACFPPSMPWRMRLSLNYSSSISQSLSTPSICLQNSQSYHLHQSTP